MKNTLKILWEWHTNVNKNVQSLVFVQCSCAILWLGTPAMSMKEVVAQSTSWLALKDCNGRCMHP